MPKQFLIGYATPHQTLLTVLAPRSRWRSRLGLRRADRGLLALAALAAGLPALLALAGTDFLITRNVIAALVPLVALAAVAATRMRAGPALAGLCAIGIVAFVGVEANALYQRDDWRAVAAALGPRPRPRAVVLDPASGAPALEFYTPLRGSPGRGLPREIDVVELRHNPPPPRRVAIAGFTTCPLRQTPEFVLVRYCAPRPVTVVPDRLNGLRLAAAPPQLLVGG